MALFYLPLVRHTEGYSTAVVTRQEPSDYVRLNSIKISLKEQPKTAESDRRCVGPLMRQHFRFSFHGRKWNEEWLKVSIDELDSRKMTPDEKASLETLIARNAESVKAESRKIK